MSNTISDTEDIGSFGKRWFIYLIAASIFFTGAYWFLGRTVDVVDNGIVHYEEFQELYNTCQKINTDLCVMKDMPEQDKMFEQFTKSQRVLSLKTNLNRWAQDYNAKSKMLNRSLWKSSTLPYQISVDEFNCYTK